MRIQFEISDTKYAFLMELLKSFSFVKNIQTVDEFVLTDEYKKEMDEYLEKHDRGELNFVGKEEAFQRLGL